MSEIKKVRIREGSKLNRFSYKRTLLMSIPAIIGIVIFITGIYILETNPTYQLAKDHHWTEEFNLPGILFMIGGLLITTTLFLTLRDYKKLVREIREDLIQEIIEEDNKNKNENSNKK